MTHPIVEAAARALCLACGDDPDREGPWSDWCEESAYYQHARAVLQSLMNPTEDMLERGASDMEEAELWLAPSEDWGKPLAIAWQAMLTQALSENK